MKIFFGTVFELIENDVIFKICFGGDLDLYWSINNINADDELDYETITITKSEYYIYNLFVKLYTSIVNCEVYKANEIELEIATSKYDVKKL